MTTQQVCIRSGNQNICKSSPIRDCSCDRTTFVDPFFREPEPRDFASPHELLAELNRVLGIWEQSQQQASGNTRKLLVLWKIAQLVLLKEIDIDKPFIITAM